MRSAWVFKPNQNSLAQRAKIHYSYCPPQPPVPPNRQPLNLIRQAIKWYVENHTQTPPFHPLHATVIAISTLHGSEDPADLLSDLPEQEDLQTGPLELPKGQRILLAINYYHETIRNTTSRIDLPDRYSVPNQSDYSTRSNQRSQIKE